jgi:fido (protein-threonine AMPylation protein)
VKAACLAFRGALTAHPAAKHRYASPYSVAREAWLQRLHRRMYDQLWTWAAQYRTTDRNLGVPYRQIRRVRSPTLPV